MELMASNLLKALGIDPEKLTQEFTTRIEQFEQGLKALNNSLVQINERQERIERMQLQILSLIETQQGKTASVREPITEQIEHGAAAEYARNNGKQPQP